MTIFEAYQLAVRLHGQHVDKAGRPYIEHLTRVFLRVQERGGDDFQQIAALLHDAVEDGKVTAQQLAWLGVPAEARELILVLTKSTNQSYGDYLNQVKSSPKALMVKLADIEDNSDLVRLAALPTSVSSRLRRKYTEAIQHLTR